MCPASCSSDLHSSSLLSEETKFCGLIGHRVYIRAFEADVVLPASQAVVSFFYCQCSKMVGGTSQRKDAGAKCRIPTKMNLTVYVSPSYGETLSVGPLRVAQRAPYIYVMLWQALGCGDSVNHSPLWPSTNMLLECTEFMKAIALHCPASQRRAFLIATLLTVSSLGEVLEGIYITMPYTMGPCPFKCSLPMPVPETLQ